MPKALENKDNTPPNLVPQVANPVGETGVNAMHYPPESSGLSTQMPPDLDELVEHLVAQKIAEAMALHKGGSQEVEFAKINEGNAPDSFLKHYRCDVSPNIQIQEVDMDRVNDGLSRGQAAIKGNWLKFSQGHFFATTPNQVAQLDWMMSHPSTNPTDPSETVGGNLSIYEHDGGDIFKCPVPGCEFLSASKNGIRAHRRATHGEAI